jgi:hypothetical protein
MDQSDIDLLERLSIEASVKLSHVSRGDLTRLMGLTGFGPGTVLWQEVMAADDPMLVRVQRRSRQNRVSRQSCRWSRGS